MFNCLLFSSRPLAGRIVKKSGPLKKQLPQAKPILDARNKIIQKNRAKIHDARDKLAQIAKRSGDARIKLMKKNIGTKKYSQLGAAPSLNRGMVPPALITQKRLQPALIKPRPAYERDIEMDVDMDYYAPSVNLRRTVKNDIAYGSASAMPPLPTFKYLDAPRRLSPDPFDCYEVPQARPYDVSEPRHLNRSVEAIPTKSILRSSSNSVGYERSMAAPVQYVRNGGGLIRDSGSSLDSRTRYASVDENSHLSQEMRSRLHRAPDVTQSVGIFSNPYAGGSSSGSVSAREPIKQVAHPNAGYRIVVSNLHSSVSQSDIKELFEDIGELIDARLVRSGVAEVIFEKLKDAENAVETYHNRQLDGQPMKCLLVNPRASNKPTAPAIKTSRRLVRPQASVCPVHIIRLTEIVYSFCRFSNLSKSSKVEIDIDALHSVLFRRH